MGKLGEEGGASLLLGSSLYPARLFYFRPRRYIDLVQGRFFVFVFVQGLLKIWRPCQQVFRGFRYRTEKLTYRAIAHYVT
eukprot:SAG11_NODE_11443_length_760_cov_1.298033_2_plen_80_part_00